MKFTRYANATEIEKADGTTILVSYSTPVAAFVPGKRGAFVATERYSNTTSRHVRAFLERHNLTGNPVPQAEIAALLEAVPAPRAVLLGE